MEQTLKKIGLTDGESRVYLALLELGASATGKIIQKSSISGSKVYEVLDRLALKGLVNTSIKNKVKYFEAAPPLKLLNYLEEKRQNIDQEKREVQKILPQLLLKQQYTPRTEVKIYTGWEGMKTVNEDIIHSLKRKEEWLEMGLSAQPKSWEIYFTKKQQERAKKGIIHRSLLNTKYKSLYHTRKHLQHTYYRFLPQELEMPISTNIYNNKVAIFMLVVEEPLVIVMESKLIADSFRKYFEILWNSSIVVKK